MVVSNLNFCAYLVQQILEASTTFKPLQKDDYKWFHEKIIWAFEAFFPGDFGVKNKSKQI